ncbi:NLR family CARD domain-containing protein 3-like isoform X2 [Dysidea avara]|uniref:NLR family CARD domain-containing protein 3-like isoform X2 n=1 Tax=Dysidea avara TaxID=196820 RepID=UPI00331B46ED
MMEGNHPDAFNWRSLPGDRLNDVCTDLVIVKLAIEMTCWEPFALPLGLSDAKVTEIQRSNPDYLYQKQKFLIEWKKQHGSKASYYKLFECFEMLDRRDLIEVLIPLCLDQNKESNHTGLNGYRIDGNDDVDKTVQQYYVNLVKFLPMDDPLFRAELCSVGLLPRNLKSEISSKPTSADKAEHFLDNGIKSNSSSFWKLVKVMKNTNDDNVQQLAVQIELHYKSAFHTSTINFNQSVYKAYKSDGVVQPVLFLTSALSYDVTVQVSSINKTATGKVICYDPGPHSATFNAGICNVSIEIQISCDNISEGSVNFDISIDLPSLPSGVVAGACIRATVTIIDHLISYKNYLIRKYESLQISSAIALSECFSPEYVNLKLIKVDSKGNKESNISGKLDDMLRSTTDELNTQFSLSDILNVSTEPRKVILVVGGPGMGKSTLAIKLCQCWGKGNLLMSYDVVILLTLRDPQIQKAKTFEDLLSTTAADIDHQLMQKVIEDIKAHKGHNILFLLEGYDELPVKLQSNHNCIFNCLMRVLPRCTIIYTSRPNACLRLSSLASRKIKIQGFEHEQIYEYIHNAFSHIPEGEQKSSELISQLQKNPTIKAITSVPINVVIVCHLFYYEECLPETLTEIYHFLCKHVILWHIKNRTENEQNITVLYSLDCLPDNITKQFAQLCFIAYKGVMDDIIIFSTENFQRYGIFDGNVEGLSLLTNAPTTMVHGLERSYNFLHRTVQEFCAAWYVNTKLSPQEQCECFDRYHFSGNVSFVWRFYSGLSEFSNKELFKSMLPSKYVNTQFKNANTLELMHCIYEACKCDWSELAASLGSKIDLSYCLLDQASCSALGYFLKKYNGDIKKIDLSFCDINEDCCKILNEALCTRLQLNSQPVSVNLDITTVRCDYSSIASLLQSGYPISTLTVSNSILTNSIQPAMKLFNVHKSLTELVIRDAALDLFSVRMLSNALMINCTLKILNIGNNDLGSEGAKYFSFCRNIHLTDLIMWQCNLGPSGAVMIGKMVTNNSSIKCLRIGNNSIGNDGIKDFVNTIIDCNNLHCLDLWGNLITSTGAKHLKRLLTTAQSQITTLVLGANPLRDSGVLPIMQAISQNSNIKELDIRDTSITSVSSLTISESVKNMQTLRFTPPVECKDISKASASNKITLKHMQLHNGTDTGYVILLQGIYHNYSNLRKLEFSRGELGATSIHCLKCIVEHSTVLKELVLRWMDINPTDYLLLATAFKVNGSVEKLSITPLDSQKYDHNFAIEFLNRLTNNLSLKEVTMTLKVIYGLSSDINITEHNFLKAINQCVNGINNHRQQQNIKGVLTLNLLSK